VLCPICEVPIAKHDELHARWCYRLYLWRPPSAAPAAAEPSPARAPATNIYDPGDREQMRDVKERYEAARRRRPSSTRAVPA